LHTQSILISEPLANKHSLVAGDKLSLFTETEGDVDFVVAGVYQDYGSSHGRIIIHRSNYARFWNNTEIGSIGIGFEAGANNAATIERIRQQTKQLGTPTRVRDNVSIHQESLAIFDRTFAVTRVLRWLTMGVAFIGIFSALLAMHLERARDFAILRASGGSHTQLRQIIAVQSVAMGIAAGLAGIYPAWRLGKRSLVKELRTE